MKQPEMYEVAGFVTDKKKAPTRRSAPWVPKLQTKGLVWLGIHCIATIVM